MGFFDFLNTKEETKAVKAFRALDNDDRLDFITALIQKKELDDAITCSKLYLETDKEDGKFFKPTIYYLMAYSYTLKGDKANGKIAVKKGIDSLKDSMVDSPIINMEHPTKTNLMQLLKVVESDTLTLKAPPKKDEEGFNNLIDRLNRKVRGDLSVTTMGQTLVLRSEAITSAVSALGAINTILQDEEDWHIFKSMNFDGVFIKGDGYSHSLTIELLPCCFSDI